MKKEKRERKNSQMSFHLIFPSEKHFNILSTPLSLFPAESLVVVCELQLKLKMHSNSLDEREECWVGGNIAEFHLMHSRHLHACMHLSHSFRASFNLTFSHSFFHPLSLSCADDKKFSPFPFLSTPQSAHNPFHLVCECGGKFNLKN